MTMMTISSKITTKATKTTITGNPPKPMVPNNCFHHGASPGYIYIYMYMSTSNNTLLTIIIREHLKNNENVCIINIIKCTLLLMYYNSLIDIDTYFP